MPPEERLNATDLEHYHDDLRTHLKVISYRNGHGYPVLIPLSNTRRAVRWAVLKGWAEGFGTAVTSVQIGYGLFKNAFVPVFEVVEDTGSGPVMITGSQALYNEATESFTTISTAQRDALMQHYKSNGMVMRLTGDPFTTLTKNDPGATLFHWSTKFLRLVNDNPVVVDQRYVVITSIAAKFVLVTGDPAEYHHGLALHVANRVDCDGAQVLVDLLDDTDVPGPNGQSTFTGKAMDLGSPCPPNCIK